MSSNRLMYDTSAYKLRINDSTTPLAYHLNPMKYENCKKCRSELGLLGGPAVSQIKGNLVDLENELRGQTRLNSQCPKTRYHPSNKLYTKQTDLNQATEIDTELLHLPSCQMIRYKPIALPDPIVIEHCPGPTLSTPNSCNMAPPKPVCNSF
jgi:hypothetical protein